MHIWSFAFRNKIPGDTRNAYSSYNTDSRDFLSFWPLTSEGQMTHIYHSMPCAVFDSESLLFVVETSLFDAI